MNIRLVSPSESKGLFLLDQTQPYSAHWSEPSWQAELAQPAAHVWGAYCEEKLVGFLCVRGAADQYEITNLSVEPGHTRQGIGRALLQQALKQLKTLGATQLTLEVNAVNQPARALYESCGLMVLGVRKKFYPDGNDALIMGKNL